jgi:hypothetical protein
LGEVQRVVLKDLLKRGLAGPEPPAIPQPAKLKIEIKANGLKLRLMWEFVFGFLAQKWKQRGAGLWMIQKQFRTDDAAVLMKQADDFEVVLACDEMDRPLARRNAFE